MRKLIARMFDYSLDGLIATEGTEFFQFCRDLPDDRAEDARGMEFYAGADLHIMGRAAYQSMAGYFPTATNEIIHGDRRITADDVSDQYTDGAIAGPSS